MLVRCHVCKKDKPVSATPQQVAAWNGGMLIQRAMPNVPADERELLISSTCGECFDKLFPLEGEDE